MDGALPNAKSAASPDEREKLRQTVSRRGLCGLANDTKWDEFIGAIRAHTEWHPRFRYKCIDGTPSRWDVEWFYHLPFPLLSIEWPDVAHVQQVQEHRLPPRVSLIDHSSWIEKLLRDIGLEYQKGTRMIRIFGYSPRSTEQFDE